MLKSDGVDRKMILEEDDSSQLPTPEAIEYLERQVAEARADSKS